MNSKELLYNTGIQGAIGRESLEACDKHQSAVVHSVTANASIWAGTQLYNGRKVVNYYSFFFSNNIGNAICIFKYHLA